MAFGKPVAPQRVTLERIAETRILVPNMAAKEIDWAIQAHGGGTRNDFGLAPVDAMLRVLRLADGPDEVHRDQLGKMELRKHA